MRLKVLLPTNILVDEEVSKIVAEGENGAFCLLPRHVDFVAALAAGLLSFTHNSGREEFLAIDEAVLVKCGAEVLVSAKNAVRGEDLGELTKTVEEEFNNLDEREEKSRLALAKLEAGLISRLIELEH